QITDPTPYCPNNYQESINAGQPHINEVLLETINQISLHDGYTFYDNSMTVLETGEGYSLQFNIVGASAQGAAAWIDFNSDDVFEESEKIGEIVNVGAIEGAQQFDFTVPATAVLNQTRLRLRVVEHDVVFIDSAVTSVEPCQVQVALDVDGNPVIEDYEIGETEDYMVWIQNPAFGEDTLVNVTSQNDEDFIDVNGGTLQLFAQTNPFPEPVTWSVTAVTGLASIDADGLLTAIADGEVTVVASATIGGEFTEGEKTIQISNQAPVFEIEAIGSTETSLCQGSSDEFTVDVDLVEAFGGLVNFSVEGAPTGVFITLTPDATTNDVQVIIDVNNVSAPTITSELTFIASAPDVNYQDTLFFDLSTYNNTPLITSLISPSDGAINQPFFINLDWNNTIRAASYEVEISTNENFTTTVYTQDNITDSEHSPFFFSQLGTIYYWRVRAINPCGNGEWSSVWSYSRSPYTLNLGCTDPEALNYDSSADLEDGSCEYTIEGCTDPLALNYDEDADVDDGSCYSEFIFMVIEEVVDTAFDFSLNHVVGDIAYVAWNFGDGSDVEYGEEQSHEFVSNGTYPIEAQVYSNSLEQLFFVRDTIIIEAWGCTDPYSINFDIPAVYDDGSCEAI
ncbi:MAG: GEVED domain-containing protein, partial [Flavobacteriales bacterium]